MVILSDKGEPILLIIRTYKKNKRGKAFWEYKIVYKDIFSHKTKSTNKRGFPNRMEAEQAAYEMMFYLKQSIER